MKLPCGLDEAVPLVDQWPAAYVVSPTDFSYLYKGSARDLRARLNDHRAGRVGRTRHRRPLVLVHVDYCYDYQAAQRRERWLKTGYGREWLNRLLTARIHGI